MSAGSRGRSLSRIPAAMLGLWRFARNRPSERHAARPQGVEVGIRPVGARLNQGSCTRMRPLAAEAGLLGARYAA